MNGPDPDALAAATSIAVALSDPQAAWSPAPPAGGGLGRNLWAGAQRASPCCTSNAPAPATAIGTPRTPGCRQPSAAS